VKVEYLVDVGMMMMMMVVVVVVVLQSATASEDGRNGITLLE